MHKVHTCRVRMDLNLFRVFDAIYRSGSLTRAAETLNLSQPAVSHALSRLRDGLGDPLFRREGRGMVATPRAHALAADVRQALALLDGSRQGSAPFEPARSTRRFIIGVREAIESAALPELAQRLRQQAPGVILEAVSFARETVAPALARGQLDVVIDVPLPLGSEILRTPLYDDPLCIVMRRDHPLAAAPLRRDDWLAADHVVVSGRPSGLSLEDDALRRAGLHRRIALRCQNYQTACRAVAASDLLLALPRRVASTQAELAPIVRSEPPVPLPSLRGQLYWHHAADEDAANRWLRAQVCAVMQEQQAPAD